MVFVLLCSVEGAWQIVIKAAALVKADFKA
jgi:hypothetical protein